MVYYCQLLASMKWEIVGETVFKRWADALATMEGGVRYTGKRFILDESADTIQFFGSFTKQELRVITSEAYAIEPEQVILQNNKGKKEVHFKGGYKATLKAA